MLTVWNYLAHRCPWNEKTAASTWGRFPPIASESRATQKLSAEDSGVTPSSVSATHVFVTAHGGKSEAEGQESALVASMLTQE
jgi:hypothetical protein